MAAPTTTSAANSPIVKSLHGEYMMESGHKMEFTAPLIQPNENGLAPCLNSFNDRDFEDTHNEQAQPEVADADEPK